MCAVAASSLVQQRRGLGCAVVAGPRLGSGGSVFGAVGAHIAQVHSRPALHQRRRGGVHPRLLRAVHVSLRRCHRRVPAVTHCGTQLHGSTGSNGASAAAIGPALVAGRAALAGHAVLLLRQPGQRPANVPRAARGASRPQPVWQPTRKDAVGYARVTAVLHRMLRPHWPVWVRPMAAAREIAATVADLLSLHHARLLRIGGAADAAATITAAIPLPCTLLLPLRRYVRYGEEVEDDLLANLEKERMPFMPYVRLVSPRLPRARVRARVRV